MEIFGRCLPHPVSESFILDIYYFGSRIFTCICIILLFLLISAEISYIFIHFIQGIFSFLLIIISMITALKFLPTSSNTCG